MNVTKIILTRCQIFHLKRIKFNFSRPLAGFEEKGREKGGKWGRGRGVKGGRGRLRGKGNLLHEAEGIDALVPRPSQLGSH